MIKLKKVGKAVNLGTGFMVIVNDRPIGVAYRAESGCRKGLYSFGEFIGSRARLLIHAAKLA